MAKRQTAKFLPTVFQTDTNKKFLAATMDQLVNEPSFQRLYGYVGRRFAPTYNNGDSYVQESTTVRQNYQLEPAVVVADSNQYVNFLVDYQDILGKIQYLGGYTQDQNRLFAQGYYTYDPKISFDKLINFSQYYWLPNGPDPVLISTDGVELDITYVVTRDAANGRYVFRNQGVVDSSIIATRGGVIRFVVDQPGYPFWIQTELGTAGTVSRSPTISSREVLGVTNNGTDQGTVTFKVPLSTAQDRWVKMPMVFSVDYAAPLPYKDLQNQFLQHFTAQYPQYAGITGQLNGKYLVFLTTSALNNLGETAWTNPQAKDVDGDVIPGYESGVVVPDDQRSGVWQVLFADVGQKLRLDTAFTAAAAAGARVTVTSRVTSNIGAVSTVTTNSSLLYDAQPGQSFVYINSSAALPQGNVSHKVSLTPVTTAMSQTAAIDNSITVTGIQGFTINMPVRFQGVAIGSIDTAVTYRIKDFPTPTSMRIADYNTGNVITLTDGIGNMTVTGYYTQLADSSQVLSIWRSDPLLRMSYTAAVQVDNKVYVKYGVNNANREFYRDYDGFFKAVPLVSAPLDQLWIQDTAVGTMYQNIKLIDYKNWQIDVAQDIVGQQNYTSPNGVEFTSGLKIEFGSDVTDTNYANKQFYVEQVGDLSHGIQLVPVDELVTPEAYQDYISTNYDTALPDYITINRASRDRNPWSRSNRWFHIDVITATATYNNEPANFTGAVRAQRPILQYEANLQLLNFGRKGKRPVDFLDTTSTNAFVDLQGKTYSKVFGVDIKDADGLPIYPDGIRVIFAADRDPAVANKIHVLTLVQYTVDDSGVPNGPYYIELALAEDGDLATYDSTVVTGGVYRGSGWWYDGVNWLPAQDKKYIQQQPLFDVVDVNGRSFSTYNKSTFQGTAIMSYARATSGVADTLLSTGPVAPVLDSDGNAVYEFYLSYRNFYTQGDIQFNNNFNTDTFTYADETGVNFTTAKVNLGYLQKIQADSTYVPKNTWLTVPELSKQYQVFEFTYDGATNKFTVDILPADNESSIPYVKVFRNFEYITQSLWQRDGYTITVLTPLTQGDNINVLIYSAEVSATAYYEVPKNLDLNAQNSDMNSLTLGQMRNHLLVLEQNTSLITGHAVGASNLRDVDIKQQGGTILKHSAPTPYAQLFLVDQQSNFVDAVKLASTEYQRFKNKFLETAKSLPGVDPTDPVAAVDLILTKINSAKSKSFPWYYSDMVPYGALKTTVGGPQGITVSDPYKTNYEISQQFKDTELSNRAVLIYLNGQQLIKGIDYTFSTVTPSVDFTQGFAVGDIIKIVEYSNTDGNYIPETPSKLGMWPAYDPARFYDDTYRNPQYVIRGHDGSITVSFGDFRDELLLELEKRIFNNIKVAFATTFADIYRLVPGRFRTSDYTLQEINTLLGTSFLNWVGNNKLDYTLNDTFEANDAFTWNFGGSHDRLGGQQLQGSWRACYQYFYDTWRPHQAPWECLGFSSMPDWWEGYYGPAPYTGTNKLLWQDLEAGLIRYGPRQGIDTRWARPGLSAVIPVDENGNLLSPAHVLCGNFNSRTAGSAWSVGQYGPVEFAWRVSSDFPFAVQQALALAKPAQYFGNLVDTGNYGYLNVLYEDIPLLNQEITQYLYSTTNSPITQDVIIYNGYVESGVVRRSSGYLNWIADSLINRGIDPSMYLLPLIRNFAVRLSYKVSGFTDQDRLQISFEQASPGSVNSAVLVPNENYQVYLNDQPVPNDKIVYSAVIVERTVNGYSVRGYDLYNSFFTIIPSVVNNNASSIKVLQDTVLIYKNYQNRKLRVPYGYEFKNSQQVADFLVSYERWLVAQGWTFKETEPQLQYVKDFKLSVREFLYWSQLGWKPGSIIVLSPVSNKIHAVTAGAVAAGITDSQYGSKLLDQNFYLVKNNRYTVNRTATAFDLRIDDAASVIGYLELNLVRFEHTLVFDNITVFNDIIYQPQTGDRQYRLKLVGQRSADWDGSVSVPGYVYSSGHVNTWSPSKDYLQGDLVTYKSQYYAALQLVPASAQFDFTKWQLLPNTEIRSGLLPNFSTLAVASQSYYDSYAITDTKQQQDYAHALIGYKPRQYLSDLGLTDTTQIELYKGYVAQKGTRNAVDAFTSANISNLSSSIAMYEEWALRVGEYGALDSNPFVEVALNERAFSGAPSVLQFASAAENNTANGIDIISAPQLVKSWGQFTGNIAVNRSDNSNYDNDIPTAGYVNINDVDLQIFDISNYSELNAHIQDMGSGYRIWVARDSQQRWNVYRVSETNNLITQVSNSLNGYITFTCEYPHELATNELFLLRNFSTQFDGFYSVTRVVDAYNVLVKYSGSLALLTNQLGSGMLLRLDSMRFRYMEDSRVFALSRPKHKWRVGDKIWIDLDAATSTNNGQTYNTPTNTWKVYEKTQPWHQLQELRKPNATYAADQKFGEVVRITQDSNMVLSGAPGYAGNVGQVLIWQRNYEGTYDQTRILSPIDPDTQSFGASIETATDSNGRTRMAVGAPNTVGGYGQVYVYSVAPDDPVFTAPDQILQANVLADKFGSSMAYDQTGEWLYVGAPGNNTVYVYGLNRFVPRQTQIANINSQYVLYFSGNLTANVGDVIVQDATTARARVVSITSNAEYIVDTVTNFVTANILTSGAITIDSANVSANVSVLSLGIQSYYAVFPVGTASNAVVSTVSLNFTPAFTDANCLSISDAVNSYVAGRDFTISGNVVTFANAVGTTSLTIRQRPFYQLLTKLTIPTGNSWSRFGAALSSSYDGAQLAVGAPGDTVADATGTLQPGAGAVYVFDRVIEAFNTETDATAGTGGLEYQTANPIAQVYKVTIDGKEVNNYQIVGNNTVRFTTPPLIGQVMYVEVNQFNLLDRLVGIANLTGDLSDIQANTAFGTSLTICSNNCAIYIGAPNYRSKAAYGAGAVWKFHNRGRLYGTNTGYTRNPTFVPVETLRLNNFEVSVSLALSGIVNVRAGDVITQPSTGAMVMVTQDATVTNRVAVGKYLTANTFVLGANIAINSAWPISNVAVRATTLDEFVQDVNSQNILGVTARNANGYLQFNSNVTIAKDQLRILSGTNYTSSGILAESGTLVFAFMQIIVNPYGLSHEYFGSKVKLAQNAYMLVISSDAGTTRELTTWDHGTTRFDTAVTEFADFVPQSGSVYIYELYDDPRNEVENPGRYSFAQQLVPNYLLQGDKFGHDIDISGHTIAVSAPGATAVGINARALSPQGAALQHSGTLYLFDNPLMTRGWQLIRYQQPKVDTDSLTRAYLYNDTTKNILRNLQLLDPAKGRILGQAEQEISYKTDYDPAVYNRGDNTAVTIQPQTYWAVNQVGKLWWNLSRVSYIDYEQDSLDYRKLHWGELFLGSVVQVNEWVVSTYMPSEYAAMVGDGVALYADDSAYVEQMHVDPTTGIISSQYYYWVTGKTTVDSNLSSRHLPAATVADYIANPKNQGIAYVAAVRADAVAFYNISSYLSGDNTVFHVDYQDKINTNVIHSEYELVQEGNPAAALPQTIVAKLIDSLSGIDSSGAVVPDPTLHVSNRYGIGIRPRQTMFENREAAIHVMVDHVNTVFAAVPVAKQQDITGLFAAEPEPSVNSGAYDQRVDTDVELAYIDTQQLVPGHRVLVSQDTTQDSLWVIYTWDSQQYWQITRVQAYKTSRYWYYADWYAPDYSAATKPDFSVSTTVDAVALNAAEGTVIYIQNATGDNTWQLVTVVMDPALQEKTLSVVGIQNGTIQLDTKLSNYTTAVFGFGSTEYDLQRYNYGPDIEIRYIIQALHDTIFQDNLEGKFLDLFFVMVKYLLSEQNYVDWIFKTSFISINHKLRSLRQFPNYVLDNQTYYRNYIEEVKPYRTKIRDYVLNYSGIDSFAGALTDFDLPAYYDTSSINNQFRSPSGESPYQDMDEQRWQQWPWNQWYNNRLMSVAAVTVTHAGSNYALPPTVTIQSADGYGTGAKAVAVLSGNGTIASITVTNPGSGYLTTPRVLINGSSTEPAAAYVVLQNQHTRSFDSTLRFDRVSYRSNIKQWTPNTNYKQTQFESNGRVTAGDVVSYAHADGNVNIRRTYFVNANIVSGNTFVATDYTLCASSYFDNANDRILGYYEPQPGMPAVETTNIVVTAANSAVDTNTIYVFNTENLLPNMYIADATLPACRIQQVYGGITVMSRSAGWFLGNTVSGTTTIEGIVDLGTVQPGDYVSGTGIPPETIVISVNPTTHSVNLSDEITEDVFYSNISFGGIPIKAAKLLLDTNVTIATDTTFTVRYHNLEQLVPGITYDSAVTKSLPFKTSTSFGRTFDFANYDPVQYTRNGLALLSKSSFDQWLYSSFANVALGTAPQDLVTKGGAFVDPYHSHAPEELVPGITYDAVDIQVYTKYNGNANVCAYHQFTNMLGQPTYLRISTAYSSLLTQDLHATDEFIHVVNAAVFSPPSVALAAPGVVFIKGERITFYRNYRQEVQPWVGGVSYGADTVLSHGGNNYISTVAINSTNWDSITRYRVQLQGNLTAPVGSYLTQLYSNANAMIVSANVTNSSEVVVQYLSQPQQFTMGGGNLRLNGELIRPANVTVRAQSFGGNVIRVNNTLGMYVGMNANIGFAADAQIVQIYANANVVMSSGNTIALNGTAVAFGDTAQGDNTNTGYGVQPQAEFGNLRMLTDINVLGQLRRGTQGTSIHSRHVLNTPVFDAGTVQLLPNTHSGNLITFANVFYNDGYGTAVDGTGLSGSYQETALFLKQGFVSPVFLPGVNNNIVTENALNIIITEDNLAIFTED